MLKAGSIHVNVYCILVLGILLGVAIGLWLGLYLLMYHSAYCITFEDYSVRCNFPNDLFGGR